jgi:cytochrome oxidase assembly protein ShyY1
MSFLFTRRWLRYIALTLAAAVACVFLANWQNNRREARDAEIDRIETHYGAAPVPLAHALPSPDAPFAEEADWTRVSVEGTYRPEDTVLARNRPKDGRAGSWVLVPFETEAGPTLLVARGWVPGSGAEVAAGDLPDAPEGEVTVTAWLRPAQEGRAGENTEASAGAVGSVRAVDPDLVLGDDAGDHYRHAYAYLDAEDPAPAQAPEALPAPDTDPGSHLSYTMQWIAFAFMFLGGLAYAAKRERDAIRRGERGQAGPGTESETEYVVVDKAALMAGGVLPASSRRAPARPSPVSRRTPPRTRRRAGAEADEDAALEQQLR